MENPLEHDHDEITATGDLWKQSQTGGKLWSLRRFILTNIYLVYYNKKGEKRGQWDISDCILQKMSPEEAGSKSAQHAFAVIGHNKLFLLNANTDQNRAAWIKIIEEQIEEFRDPDRRHMRSGEQIYGKGVIKKKNMFGMGTNVRLIITNYPRIMVIDPAPNVKRHQISWAREDPPALIRINDTRFKIEYMNKEFSFEDAEKGTSYWENVFKKFPNMKYFVPKRRNTLNIDYRDFVHNDDSSVLPTQNLAEESLEDDDYNDEQAESNLRFLKDAQNNIHELVNSLATKIDEIDVANDMAMAGGVYDDDQQDVAEARINKRRKLQILKDNVTVLSNNLDSLAVRSAESPNGTYVDVKAIEAIIAETSKMIDMLNNDDIDLSHGHHDISDEIAHMDMVADEMEEEAWAMDDMIANVENLNFYGDDLMDELEKSFQSIDLPSDLTVNALNFSPQDTNKRPVFWKDARLKRVMIKEYVDRLEGVPEDQIRENRARNIAMEEEIMIQEMASRGRLLNVDAIKGDFIDKASVFVTKDNFDPIKPAVRPPAWRAIRLKRVIAKEDVYRNLGVDDESIVMLRPTKVIEEEKIMLMEVASGGQLDPLREGGLRGGAMKASELEINESTFNPYDSALRPVGWNSVRTQRVLAKEAVMGADKDRIRATRPHREAEEEKRMINEVLRNGIVNDTDEISTSYPLFAAVEHMHFDDLTYDANTDKRPVGWNELRAKRVILKEFADRKTGHISDDQVIESRQVRELKEESIMKAEIEKYGHVLNIGPNITSSTNSKNDPLHCSEISLLAMKRAMAREKVDKDRGMHRPKQSRHQDEESLIEQEFRSYGQGLYLGESSVRSSSLVLTADTFDPLDRTKRPSDWADLVTKRVEAKEKAANNSNVNRSYNRAKKEQDEDDIMVNEAMNYRPCNRPSGNALDFDRVVSSGLDFSKFNPSTPLSINNRPKGWNELKSRRIHLKERALSDSSGDGLMEPIRERCEEEAMLKEFQNYGDVFIPDDAHVSVDHDLVINAKTFNATDPAVRPNGWNDLRERRVLAKEYVERKLNGMNEQHILETRYQRTADEEDLMISEVMNYGNVLCPKSQENLWLPSSVSLDKIRGDQRPLDWEAMKSKRIVARARATGMSGVVRNKVTREDGDDDDHEVDYRSRFELPLQATASIADPDSEGWKLLRSRRVHAKEHAARNNSKDHHLSPEQLQDKLCNEDKLMKRELQTYGALLAYDGKVDDKLQLSDLVVNESNFDENDSSKRPPGWNEVKQNRVNTKEMVASPAAELFVLDSYRKWREEAEEEAMLNEIKTHVPFQRSHGRAPCSLGSAHHPAITAANIKINADNYDPKTNKRPDNWDKVRAKRVNSKQQLANMKLSAEERLRLQTILEEEEEAEMQKEYELYDIVFDYIEPVSSKNALQIAEGLTFNPDTFDPRDASRRPAGWQDVKLNRVLTKEKATKTASNSLAHLRPQRLQDEEELMLSEFTEYGMVFDIDNSADSQLPSVEQLASMEETCMLKDANNYKNIFKFYDLKPADIVINRANFDAHNPKKRPPGWTNLRDRRVLVKENVCHINSSTVPRNIQTRRQADEDELMVHEVIHYGYVFDAPFIDGLAAESNRNIKADSEREVNYSDLKITSSNFNANNPNIRPTGWDKLKGFRVFAKEEVDRNLGVTEDQISQKRLQRFQQEEALMVQEVAVYHAVLDMSPSANQTRVIDISDRSALDSDNTSHRPKGWKDVLQRRLHFKETVDRHNNGQCEETIQRLHDVHQKAEDGKMLAEISKYGTPLVVGGVGANDLEINQFSYDSRNPFKRPIGWNALRRRRVLGKQKNLPRGDSSSVNADEDDSMMNELLAEERVMIDEVELYGCVLNLPSTSVSSDERIVQLNENDDVIIDKASFDPNDKNKRPKNWANIRMKRVLAKEMASRDVLPIVDVDIFEYRDKLLKQEESLMVTEVLAYGTILGLRESGSSNARINEFIASINKNTSGDQVHAVGHKMVINKDNFDFKDPHKRPSGWANVRMKRMLSKSKFQSHETQKSFAQRNQEEELLMLHEVHMYGDVLSTHGDICKGFTPQDMVITPLLLDPANMAKRPSNWNLLRKLRIEAKEANSKETGGENKTVVGRISSLFSFAIDKNVKDSEKDEDELMLSEVKAYGRPLALGAEYCKPATAYDLVFSKSTYDAADPFIRPEGWFELRNERIRFKEEAAEVDTHTYQSMHAAREKDEEAIMMSEVEHYGLVLPVTSVTAASKLATSKGDPKAHPEWLPLRFKRVQAKESCFKVDAKTRLDMRASREINEEQAMLAELAAYGKVFEIGIDAEGKTNVPTWRNMLMRRVLAKEQTMHVMDTKTLLETRNQRMEEEDAIMGHELALYGTVLSMESLGNNILTAADIIIDKSTFDPKNPLMRPAGWTEIRRIRVVNKELAACINKESLLSLRPAREEAEEEIMIIEASRCNKLSPCSRYTEASSIVINESNFNETDSSKRPFGWKELKARRIAAKQSLVSPHVIAMSNPLELEKTEEYIMQLEARHYGKVFIELTLSSRNKSEDDATHEVAIDLLINDKTFDPTNPKKRPPGWATVRNERIALKMFNKPKLSRAALEKEEEELMIREVVLYGNALSCGSRGNMSSSVQSSDIVLQEHELKESDSNHQPLGWSDMKRNRIYARELKERSCGVSEAELRQSHTLREKSEDELMCNEVQLYGFVLNCRRHFDASDLIFNEQTFDAKDPTQRPNGWNALRNKRVLAKEFLQRKIASSLDSRNVTVTRAQQEKDEESSMVREVSVYGTILGLAGPFDDTYRNQQDLACNDRNFDAIVPNKRPMGWNDLRMRRILAKERIERTKGMKDDQILERRPRQIKDMESVMVQEALEYGCVLGAPSKGSLLIDPAVSPVMKLEINSKNFDPALDSDIRPPGWKELRLKRVMLKEAIDRLAGVSESICSEKRMQREKEEEELMVEEVLSHYSHYMAADGADERSRSNSINRRSVNLDRMSFRGRANTLTGTVVITPDNFDPNDPFKRPAGWRELRNKRVVVKEQIDRLAGVDEETIAAMRDDRELIEEELMLAEVMQTGTVAGARRESDSKEMKVEVNGENFVATDLTKRPDGWNELRLKRMMLKEHLDRLNGIEETAIVDKRPALKVDEEMTMIEEVEMFGRPLNVGEHRSEAEPMNKKPSTIRSKRHLIKEQLSRQNGDEGDIDVSSVDRSGVNIAKAVQRRKSQTLLMKELLVRKERAPTSYIPFNVNPSEARRLTYDTLPPLEINVNNFDPNTKEKRPSGWAKVRERRIHRREQLDRLRGVVDAIIMEKRLLREKEEEEAMIKEVVTHGNVLGVHCGGLDIKTAMEKAKEIEKAEREANSSALCPLVILESNFDPNIDSKRPNGWHAVRKRRVYKREQLDRFRGITEAVIQAKRAEREKEEEEAMLREVALHGNVLGMGGAKKAAAAGAASSTSEDKPPEELEMNFDAEEFDAKTSKRPKGWAVVKLRRVYIKEWKDRKNGVSEEEIMERRYQREQEVEQEMIQEMSVNGRIRAFEKQIQRNKQKGKVSAKGFQQDFERYKGGVIHNAVIRKPPRRGSTRAGSVKRRRSTVRKSVKVSEGLKKSDDLGRFIDVANLTLETLTEKVADNIASTNSKSSSPTRGLRHFNRPLASGPRIIAPRAAPVTRSHMNSPEKAASLRTVSLHVNTLNITRDNFHPEMAYQRPPGWSLLKERRITAAQIKFGLQELSDENLSQKMRTLSQKVELEMIDEAKAVLASSELCHSSNSNSNLLRNSPTHSTAELAGPGFKANPLLKRTASGQNVTGGLSPQKLQKQPSLGNVLFGALPEEN